MGFRDFWRALTGADNTSGSGSGNSGRPNGAPGSGGNGAPGSGGNGAPGSGGNGTPGPRPDGPYVNERVVASSLLSITRGGSDPHGKPRVFIACHPQDHKVYFDWIVTMLHEYQNCAIYYEDPNKGPMPWETLVTYLSEVQLIVVPVTTRLLMWQNRVMNQIVPFAEENHIPVLPLMMEHGLDELFGKRFGSAQYLEPGNRDSTAISFEQKLEKYLLGVLVGDDLALKVRAAFTAYIFLSYRKKDRAFAQTLIRMIHKDKKYRDIAIWYDEYLQPGENFNDSIWAALKKGLLFVLVVTPSLLEKDNYVMREEYPAALRAEKKIMPVEMKETDRNELKKYYDRIPEIINAEDAATVKEALERHLGYMKFILAKTGAWHEYLMGLAYLEGIDVEIDREQAVELITGAANGGVAEAAEKLAAMYYYGKGVARDYRKSVAWREKAVELWRMAWEKSRDNYYQTGLYKALLDLGREYFDLREFESAKRAFAEMMRLSQERTDTQGSFELASAYIAIGMNELSAQGNVDEAVKWFKMAYEIILQIPQEEENLKWKKDLLIACCQFLATVAMKKENFIEARKWHEKGIELVMQDVEEKDSAKSGESLAIAYDDLADIEKAQGNLSAAEDFYKRSLRIRQRLADELKMTHYRRLLSISYSNLGKLEWIKNNLADAAKLYEIALRIRLQLAEETGSMESRFDLVDIYNKLGELELGRQNFREATKWYEKAYEIASRLLMETRAMQARKAIAFICDGLGRTELMQKRVRKAADWFEKSYEQAKLMYQELQTTETSDWYSLSCIQLGSTVDAAGDHARGKILCEEGIRIREYLAREIGTMEEYDKLALSYGKISVLGGKLNRGYAMKAYRIYEDLARKCPQMPMYAGRRDMFKKALGL